MSAHTPGPWAADTASRHPYEHVYGGHGIYSSDRTLVAETLSGLDGEAANARLIAAAPQLLELLQQFALSADDGDDAAMGTHYVAKDGRIRCKGSFLDLLARARAAIAAATGDS